MAVTRHDKPPANTRLTPAQLSVGRNASVIRRASATPATPASLKPVQRRVGFEFQTNINLRDHKDSAPPLRQPLLARPGWHIVCDQGELEFVTDPFVTYEEAARVVGEIVSWSNQLATLDFSVPEHSRKSAANYLQSEFDDDRQMGREILLDNETRPLNLMSANKGSKLESLNAVGPAQNMTGSPQTTFGLPLDKIISAMHLIANEKYTLNAGSDKQNEVKLSKNQAETPTLVPARVQAVTAVAELRERNPELKDESSWRQLEGIIALAASYIRSAHVATRPTYSYIKEMATLMSRVNFGAILEAIPEEMQPLFTSDIVAKAANVTADDLVFGRQGAIRDDKTRTMIKGPTVGEWIVSIHLNKDALSVYGAGEENETGKFIKGSESMGKSTALDKDDPKYKMPLVPIELRGMTKGVPVAQWPELTQQVMVSYNAIMKSKFF